MRRRLSRLATVLKLLVAFVVASVLMGLLGAGLAMPAVGATGAAARQGVHMFDTLPGVFTQTPLSQQSRILAVDGTVIATPYVENRKIITLDQVAPIMRTAQIDIEDRRFYSHGGVDLQGVARAVVANAAGASTQGASTLTQQYVKVTLQENCVRNGDKACAAAAVAPSVSRKLAQLKYAVILEQTQTKDQILQGYFNLVYYGGLAYGIEAAAEHFFNIHASQLNLQQAALLAGVVQSPNDLNPGLHPAAALARRNVVLDAMHNNKHITDAQWTKARKSKIELHLTASRSSCAASKYPYFCNYILAWLREQPALGKTVAQRNDALNREGLTIQTTFDPKTQKATQDQVDKRVPINNSAGISSAATVIQPGTGNVLAMAQNTNYLGKKSVQLNYNVDAKYGGATLGFQYGSTAKMYSIVTALESGMTLNSPVNVRGSSPGSHLATFLPSDYKNDGCRPRQAYTVGNDEGSTKSRTISLTNAFADSINIAFAGLNAKLGLCAVHKTMDVMGLHQYNGKSIQIYPSPITLGSDGVSPMTMAASYATVAAGGMFCQPNPVLSITTSDKKAVKLPGKQCKQAIKPEIAAAAAEIASHVLTDGTARGVGPVPGRPSAGKTGTADNNKQVWFVGFTAQLSTAVWVGTAAFPKPMNHVRLNGRLVGGSGKVYGANTPAPIWRDLTTQLSKGMPVLGFGTVTDKMRYGDRVPVPDVQGMSTASAMAALAGAGFLPQVGSGVSSRYPSGTTAFTSPGGGSRALSGSTVTIYPSRGYVPPPKPRVTPTHPQPSPSSSPSSTTTQAPSPTKTPKPKPTKTPKPKPTKTKPGASPSPT